VAAADPAVIEAPADDPLGVDADGWLRVTDRLGVAADLHATWPPRGQDVVDDDRGAVGMDHVAELLGGPEPMAGDLHDPAVGVDAPHADRGDVGDAVRADGGQAGQPAFALQIGQLGVGEGVHDAGRLGVAPQPGHELSWACARFRIHKASLGLLLSPVAVGVTGTAGQFASLDHPPGGTAAGAPASTTERRPQDRSRRRRDKGLTLPLGQGSSIWCMSTPSDAALPGIGRPAP
jgi:hypothetical protein